MKSPKAINWFFVTVAGAIVGAIAVEAYREYKNRKKPVNKEIIKIESL